MNIDLAIKQKKVLQKIFFSFLKNFFLCWFIWYVSFWSFRNLHSSESIGLFLYCHCNTLIVSIVIPRSLPYIDAHSFQLLYIFLYFWNDIEYNSSFVVKFPFFHNHICCGKKKIAIIKRQYNQYRFYNLNKGCPEMVQHYLLILLKPLQYCCNVFSASCAVKHFSFFAVVCLFAFNIVMF